MRAVAGRRCHRRVIAIRSRQAPGRRRNRPRRAPRGRQLRSSIMNARALRSIACASFVSTAFVPPSPATPARSRDDPVVPVAVTYDHPSSLDEDDMCFWVHPMNPALSTVIVTDKSAGQIFVYDLDGNLLQVL